MTWRAPSIVPYATDTGLLLCYDCELPPAVLAAAGAWLSPEDTGTVWKTLSAVTLLDSEGIHLMVWPYYLKLTVCRYNIVCRSNIVQVLAGCILYQWS
jgi:hypothetical protein